MLGKTEPTGNLSHTTQEWFSCNQFHGILSADVILSVWLKYTTLSVKVFSIFEYILSHMFL